MIFWSVWNLHHERLESSFVTPVISIVDVKNLIRKCLKSMLRTFKFSGENLWNSFWIRSNTFTFTFSNLCWAMLECQLERFLSILNDGNCTAVISGLCFEILGNSYQEIQKSALGRPFWKNTEYESNWNILISCPKPTPLCTLSFRITLFSIRQRVWFAFINAHGFG